jgi:hypothetical protein
VVIPDRDLEVSDSTDTGRLKLTAVSGSPSCPEELSPQQ